MADELDEIASTVDEVAAEQRVVARRLRSMQRQVGKGRPWSEVVDASSDVLGVLRASARQLVGATGHLATTLARGLAHEGESRRSIGSRLGISHQRVTALLRNGRRS